MRRRVTGFTLIELLIVIAVTAILLSIAAPSFITMLAQQRLKSVGGELYGDLQYARSESVQRNAGVAVTFSSTSPWCYVVHTDVTGAVCTCGAAASCSSGAQIIKNVSGVEFPDTSLALSAGVSPVKFEPRQGLLTTAAGEMSYSSANGGELKIQLNALGRVRFCAVGGAVSGVPAC